jgi:hypothetical protein
MKDIFASDHDFNKWSKQKEFITSANDIEEETKQKLESEITFLHEELGKSFFKAFSHNHPIKKKFSNKATWQIHDLIEFSDALQILKASDSNYSKLLQKLLSEKRSQIEGEPFVEIAMMYCKEEFQISFVEESNILGVRTPDLKISDPESSDSFYVEVTILNDSHALNDSFKINYFF